MENVKLTLSLEVESSLTMWTRLRHLLKTRQTHWNIQNILLSFLIQIKHIWTIAYEYVIKLQYSTTCIGSISIYWIKFVILMGYQGNKKILQTKKWYWNIKLSQFWSHRDILKQSIKVESYCIFFQLKRSTTEIYVLIFQYVIAIDACLTRCYK